MRYEYFGGDAVGPPLCSRCAQIMGLARITWRFDDLPELYIFECMSALGQSGQKLGTYPDGFTINTMVEVTHWLAVLWPGSLIKIKVTS
jgi:hypothetical protein